MKLAQVLNRDLGINVYTPATGQTVQIPLEPKVAVVNAYVHHGCFLNISENRSEYTQEGIYSARDIGNGLDAEVKYAFHSY